MSLVIDLIDLVAKHKAGELRCPATALILFSYTPLSSFFTHIETNQSVGGAKMRILLLYICISFSCLSPSLTCLFRLVLNVKIQVHV